MSETNETLIFLAKEILEVVKNLKTNFTEYKYALEYKTEIEILSENMGIEPSAFSSEYDGVTEKEIKYDDEINKDLEWLIAISNKISQSM